ncbi:uncharacterized protein LOC119433221 isoform X1 [Dermacentor silvarum]|uniref:uncharacterized protein LOC119433221 isoform X1 n=2 Tax=Dermacentor silvarum TaxID=543639 RepID=UPI00210185A6|nr:uncharacterized protein LOC119433221 isoform X1 [Dermacentor silvarum]
MELDPRAGPGATKPSRPLDKNMEDCKNVATPITRRRNTAMKEVVQQSWNSQDKNSTVTPKFTIPGHQSMDRVSNNRSLAHSSPGANNRMLEEGQNNINAVSQVSGGTLHRSSASSNISAINSPEQQQPPSQHHSNKLQRTPSHLKSGQAAQNGPHRRTWAHSRRPGHYSVERLQCVSGRHL